MHKFSDSVKLSGVQVTKEGYLVADAFTVRTGIQKYAGYEVGRPDLAVVNVYRPDSEVFSEDSIRSFSHVPVTIDHPKEAVTVENWDKYGVGEVSTDALRDGERLRMPLILKDKTAVEAVQSGKRELSAGYSCDLVWNDGVAEDGTPYQAMQTNIRANHVAIVQRGRAGPDFRIGDSASNWGPSPILTADEEIPMNLRKVVVDGISIETTDQGAEVIAKLQDQLTKAQDALKTSTSEHATALSAKDTEIGELKVKLADAEKKAPTAQQLDALATERSTVIDAAKKLKSDIQSDGKTLADIRKEAVAAKFGDDMVKDASEDMISGMFTAATKDAAPADPVRLAVLNRDTAAKVTDGGQDAYETRIRDAWKGDQSAAN